ncbi:ATP-binding cassette, subfamily B [Hathewaya proteolytica DSM 3090]|uniref:ATP-binding cassette, subfamily B n=1 Tax=Hathewaya proteolytica DSM 3090 TaxID=1121331 RepID=A0A1M6KKW6_9CLOT|nr:ABC transporter ATP-binding protein [Hathewaya proteolytica]SHJ59597.1 ATP-binding cassette, subfamily B [Hathewaya proteolytica DSM 3090]
MLRDVLKNIKVIFRYSPFHAIIKLIVVVIAALMTPLSLFFTEKLIKSIQLCILNGEPIRSVVMWSSCLITSMVIPCVCSFLNNCEDIRIKRELDTEFTEDIADKYARIQFWCFEDSHTKDILKRMGDNPQEKVFQLFINAVEIIGVFVSLVGLILVFMQIGIIFCIIFIAIIIVMMIMDFKAMNTMNTMFNNQSVDERFMDYLGQLLSEKSSLFELRLFGAVNYISGLWKDRSSKVLKERLRITIKSQGYFAVSCIMIIIWVASILFFLVKGVISKDISLGVFVALAGSADSIIKTTENLSYTFTLIAQNSMYMRVYHKFMNLPEDSMDLSVKEHGNNEDVHYIVFKDVHFAYPKTEKEILKGLSFEIKKGEKIAFVGENGAGKSTVIKLLCRLYEPQQGEILINGINIRNMSYKEIHKAISLVFQDYEKYSLTLRENVALGDIQTLNNEELIKKALKDGMAEEISENIDVNLGKLSEDGIDVSGGQWQRIAISRALVACSQFTILDEPTSALDPIAESNMYSCFQKVLQHRGSIVISHRLGSAKMADRILVLNKGVVVENGSHAELIKAQGLYADMWRVQSNWYDGGSANEEEIQ